MAEPLIIGREAEKAVLDDVLASGRSELLAVYGRRRVGKTYLIRTYMRQQVAFEFSGIHGVRTTIQLQNFTKALSSQLGQNIPLQVPANWFDAFTMLADMLQPRLRRNKVVIFLDEFPWMQTPKSNFLPAFEQFWNTWAVNKNNVVVVLCGSAASWMIKHVVRSRGGLHNRITRKIALQPFNLYESEAYLHAMGVKLNRYQLIQLYMAIGGIPQYLNLVRPGLGAAQIIDEACFSPNGFLYTEFTDLYGALFGNAGRHLSVVRSLAAKPSGLTRNQLMLETGLQSGGSSTSMLDELSASGFISIYIPFGKKLKDAVYKLTDEYSLFYLRFIEGQKHSKGAWVRLSDTPVYKTWSGYAFENICLKHVPAIKKALGINGIYSEAGVWRGRKNGKNIAQADLVIDRRDNCVNLCEMKFYATEFSIDKKYAQELEKMRQTFREETGTRKHLFLTMITSFGITKNEYSIGLVDQNLVMDDLFQSFPGI